jgi:hypothetical protein
MRPQNTRNTRKKNAKIFGEADRSVFSVYSVVYKFPEASKFGKVVAKSKIYEHTTPTSKVKKLFVEQVEKTTWAYKLSPATINLPASDGVQEIQVFNVALRTGALASDVLKTIDKAIPSPLIFVLSYKGKCRYVAAYKRPSEADRTKCVVSAYFETEWISDSRKKAELPLVLNMADLYHFFLKAIIPLPFRQGESLDDLVQRVNNPDFNLTEFSCIRNGDV